MCKPSMGCISMIVALSLSSVSVVSFSPRTKRKVQNLGLRASMSAILETSTDSDIDVICSTTTKRYGTEEIEAIILVDVLRRAGAKVTLASLEQKLEVEAFSGTKLLADAHISKCADQVYDLVALPGGMHGVVRLRDCEILEKIMKRQAEDKRRAISMAPAITLFPWGLLTRKRV